MPLRHNYAIILDIAPVNPPVGIFLHVLVAGLSARDGRPELCGLGLTFRPSTRRSGVPKPLLHHPCRVQDCSPSAKSTAAKVSGILELHLNVEGVGLARGPTATAAGPDQRFPQHIPTRRPAPRRGRMRRRILGLQSRFHSRESPGVRAIEAPSTQNLGLARRALVKYLAARPRDYLLVATPARERRRSLCASLGTVGRRHRRTDHRGGAHRAPEDAVGGGSRQGRTVARPEVLQLQRAELRRVPRVVVTYAQVASHPTRHRVRTENRKTLVIFDEIHHGGDAKTWGEAIREAFDDATRRLALTGTPFRSDDSPSRSSTTNSVRTG